jgi:hypothetical protein
MQFIRFVEPPGGPVLVVGRREGRRDAGRSLTPIVAPTFTPLSVGHATAIGFFGGSERTFDAVEEVFRRRRCMDDGQEPPAMIGCAWTAGFAPGPRRPFTMTGAGIDAA